MLVNPSAELLVNSGLTCGFAKDEREMGEGIVSLSKGKQDLFMHCSDIVESDR